MEEYNKMTPEEKANLKNGNWRHFYFFIQLEVDFFVAFFTFPSNFLSALLGAAFRAVFLATLFGAGFLVLAGAFVDLAYFTELFCREATFFIFFQQI